MWLGNIIGKTENSKLCFMYKVSNNLVPHYIEELIPPLAGNRSQYQLRDSQNYENIYTRTNILQKSCIPSSISLWNNLEQEISSSTYTVEFLYLEVRGTFVKTLSYRKFDV